MDPKPKLRLADVQRLLEEDELPGLPEHEAFLVDTAQRLVDEHGEEWVREKKDTLLAQWELELEDFETPSESESESE